MGNIGKDLPGFKLPLTSAGQAALQHNLTATVDPESLCIIGGTPRHNASGLPSMVLQTPNYVAFLYFYSYYRLIPTDGRKHTEDRRKCEPAQRCFACGGALDAAGRG